jgi:heme exporter protein CcmD
MEWMSSDHAAYIWPAYLVTALVITGLIGSSFRAYARAKRELSRAERITKRRDT